MVKVYLLGGLGNQMFQYSLGFVLAQKNNVSLVLDTTFLNDRFPRHEFTFRTFDLDVFTLQPKLSLFSEVSAQLPIPGLWMAADYAMIRAENLLGIRKWVRETKRQEFDPAILNVGGNVTLEGYWQAQKYLSGYEDAIRNQFRFRYPLEGEAKKIAEEVASSNSVALHVRRGDYVSHKNVQGTMGDVGLAYYKNAVKYISENVKDPHFFVFSNDIEWCKENIKLEFPTTYITQESAGPKSVFHLELMSLCKHNIVANSTFSWWGAWLNKNSQKIVVAPKQWSVLQQAPKNGIIPEHWITL